jgi:hypothetical protein
VLAASSEFKSAIDAQGQALGFAPAVVYVPHPIQDRTDAELRALAEGAIDHLLASLTRVDTVSAPSSPRRPGG